MDSKDLVLKQIKLYRRGASPKKEIIFYKAKGGIKGDFSFDRILLKDLGSGSQTLHRFLPLDKKAKFPQNLLRIPGQRP